MQLRRAFIALSRLPAILGTCHTPFFQPAWMLFTIRKFYLLAIWQDIQMILDSMVRSFLSIFHLGDWPFDGVLPMVVYTEIVYTQRRLQAGRPGTKK